jgi:uncharacterized protein
VKYLLVLLVVGIGLWSLLSRLRGKGHGGGGRLRPRKAKAAPVVMVACAHCGLHLPAADALPEGARLYCSDAHRRLGPAPTAPP